jgi:hypothetical protein
MDSLPGVAAQIVFDGFGITRSFQYLREAHWRDPQLRERVAA